MVKKADDERKNQCGWTEAPPLPGITGTARWALLEARSNTRVKTELVVPIFVELLPDAVGNLGRFIAFLAGATDQYSVPDHVMDRLQSEAEIKREPAPILISLLSRADAVENPFWRVMSVGAPLARSFRGEGFTCGRSYSVKKGPLSKTPVVAIIDDSIGFLHHRFRRPNGKTRFHALWIMHNDIVAGDPGPCDFTTLSGIRLTEAHINTRIASRHSEEALYRQINNGVFGPALRHGTGFHAGHGTHVLDLAAGADRGDAMAKVRIIGVQLSPASIGETSGAALDPDLMRGLEWVVEQALQKKGRFPLVINISLGSLAGPLDGTSEVERRIKAAMLHYDFWSNHAPIRVVVAYGNAHKSRLVAEVTLRKGEDVTLDWHVLPDDATSSFVEMRTPAGLGAQLAFTLSPPDSTAPLALPQWHSGPGVLQYPTPARVEAEISAEVEVDPAAAVPLPLRDKMLLTMAPTFRSDPRPLAMSGIWKIMVRNDGVDPATVSFKVRRDDTPGGYRRTGRQCWLDHANGWGWDAELRAYTLPAGSGPIIRRDTEVSYGGLVHGSAYFVGATRPDHYTNAAGAVRPSRYTAEGGQPAPEAPCLSARGDEGAMLSGIRAAGVLTGATARMSGTSMAAPSVTRHLLEYAMTGSMIAVLGAAHDPAELAYLIGGPPVAPPHPRLGVGTVPA